jgi:hypothetical protein
MNSQFLAQLAVFRWNATEFELFRYNSFEKSESLVAVAERSINAISLGD